MSDISAEASSQPRGVSDHPAKDLMQELWESGDRAKDIYQYLRTEGYPLVSRSAIAKYGQRNWSSEKVNLSSGSPSEVADVIAAYQDLGFIPDKITENVKNSWGWEKDEEGNNVQVERELSAKTIAFKAVPEAAKFEPGRLADITIISKAPERASKPAGWKLGVVYPDMQIGYFRGLRGDVETTHDESAIDVAHQVTAYLDNKFQEDGGVDRIINSGDNFDFPSFSTHLSAPGYCETNQLVFDRGATEAKAQRELARNATIDWLMGNHEYRLIKTLIDRMPSLVGLARAWEDKPVVSIPNLCRFEEFDINFHESYPEAEVWVNDNCKFTHGKLVGATPGATAGKLLGKDFVSQICGHIHRQEIAASTRRTKDGSRTVYAGSAGTLARIDGILPSSSMGVKESGRQTTTSRESWQQGIIKFWYEDHPDSAQRVRFDQVVIEDGEAIFDDKLFTATVDKNGRSNSG